MEYLDNIGKRAQAAKPDLQHLKSEEKNQILRKSADDLKLHATEILAANEKDMEKRPDKWAIVPGTFWTGFY